jgi:hypothetical protein
MFGVVAVFLNECCLRLKNVGNRHTPPQHTRQLASLAFIKTAACMGCFGGGSVSWLPSSVKYRRMVRAKAARGIALFDTDALNSIWAGT